MSDTPTVSELFQSAGKSLRADFQASREANFHNGQMGTEVEDILRKFLNEHLPQRFRAVPAFLVDSENATSKQCDVAIYDALASPVLRASPVQQILPVDHVAAVIEVKSSLNKADLSDAYEKIASCKRLKKSQLSAADLAPTGSPLSTIGTMGIVFAFDSSTSLTTLAQNALELNGKFESPVWPDLICVLDKGSITYAIQFAQGDAPLGMAMAPCTADFMVPPAYHILSVVEDGALTLNRLMALLLSQLTFFPHRPSSIRFDRLLEGASKQLTVIQGYMYDTNRILQVVPEERIGKSVPPAAEFKINLIEGKTVGQLAFFPWQDGGYVLARGIPLGPLLAMLMPGAKAVTMRSGDAEYSSVLKLTESEFRQWSDIISRLPPPSNLRLEPFVSTAAPSVQ